MHGKKIFWFILLFLLFNTTRAQNLVRVIEIDSLVGPVIDSTEKVKYHLFPFRKKEEFKEARFYVTADSTLVLAGTFSNDSTVYKPWSAADVKNTIVTIHTWAGHYTNQPWTVMDFLEILIRSTVQASYNYHCK